MKATLLPAVLLFVVLSLVTGVLYPLGVTGIVHLCCSRAAEGSLIVRNDKLLGSTLIGQEFDQPQYFWGRLSATTPAPYNGASSTGSNLGPTNPALADAVKARVEALRKIDPDNTLPVPIDLVTASGSGLDPQISPAAAEYQLSRVARARGIDAATVRALVMAHTDLRQWGVFGEPRVNVLALNLALDARH